MLSNEKRVSTNLSLYNVDNVAKLKEVQEKRKQTFAAKRTELAFKRVPILNKLDSSEFSVFVLNKAVADDWLIKYHPLNAPKGNVMSLGLVKDNMIYCIMTFKKSRNKRYYAELSRMWTLPSYQIIGGYDRLSQYASELGVNNIVAYVNLSFENPEDYEYIGMHKTRSIQKTKWWINFNSAMTDASRRQRKISADKLLADGWISVYDKGQDVYETY